jgi:peroxiredoxin Q/BCP
MRHTLVLTLLAASLGAAAPAPAAAQESDSGLLAVGEMAPDFALPGATRFGVLEEPVRLSDYRGDTVVLAFFFRVRTKG